MNCVCVCKQDPEAAVPQLPRSRAWCWCMCLGVALILSGTLIGAAYIYRFYIHQVSRSPDQAVA